MIAQILGPTVRDVVEGRWDGRMGSLEMEGARSAPRNKPLCQTLGAFLRGNRLRSLPSNYQKKRDMLTDKCMKNPLNRGHVF